MLLSTKLPGDNNFPIEFRTDLFFCELGPHRAFLWDGTLAEGPWKFCDAPAKLLPFVLGSHGKVLVVRGSQGATF